MRNPGPGGGAWTEHLIDAVGPTEFAFLVDLDNDGTADELLPEFTGAARAPLTWYELRDGEWTPHPISDRSYGHGIGAGDVNGDGRTDILTTSAHSYGICWFEQREDGAWEQHVIDNSWSHAHASVLADMDGDGRPDLVTGKRFQSRNAAAPAAGPRSSNHLCAPPSAKATTTPVPGDLR